jgi:poly-gamma-glutamate capsule biosynthesis protein CapA/YwtB (metallophosphatase superfamily)
MKTSMKLTALFLMAAAGLASGLYLNAGKSSSLPTKEVKKPVKTVPPDTSFTIVFGGDFMGHLPMTNSAYNPETGTHEFDYWFQYISPYVKSCNYGIGNLEVTLAGPPYAGFPRFSSPDSYPAAIQRAGFNMLVTANNHSQDRGLKGIERTLKVLDSLKIPHTGTFPDTATMEKEYPFLLELAGCKIAILNYTFSTNGIPVTPPNVVNMIHPERIKKDLAKAKKMGAELIFPIMHWGEEYQIKENARQREVAEMMAKNGASAVIGMHPHVVQPIKAYKIANNKSDTTIVPLAYSLGNFVSAQRKRHTDGGIMVRLTCQRKSGRVSVLKWDYLPFWVWNHRSTGKSDPFKTGYYVIPRKHLSVLSKSDSLKASVFFSDAAEILKGNTEWK